MRMPFAAAVVAAACLAGPAAAQPKPEPTVELRVRSVNDLADRFEYVAALAGQEEPAKQAKGLLAALTTEKGLEGLDPKKPFGAYGVLTADVVGSAAVLMVPVADEQRFRAMLRERVGIVAEKADGDSLKAAVPLVPEPVFLRFADGYLFVARKSEHLAAGGLVDPKAFFARDDGSVASVVVRLDRVPADLKALSLGQFELRVNEDRKKQGANETAAQRAAKNLAADAVLAAAKSVFDDGQELTAHLRIDPKTDDLGFDVSFAAKPGSPLAKSLAAAGGRPSLPLGIASGSDATFGFGVKVGVPDAYSQRFAAAVDEAIKDAVENAKSNDRPAAKRVLETLAPTLKAGELDATVSAFGPDADGKFTARAAFAVKDGKAIEQLLKDFAFVLPADKATVTFDLEKVGGFSLHRVVLKKPDAGFEKAFAGNAVWLATSADTLAVSIEPAGDGLRAALKVGPKPFAVLESYARLAAFLPSMAADQGVKPDAAKALVKEVFGDNPAGSDVLHFSVQTGERTVVRLRMKGLALKALVGLDQLKKK